jgi:hypothetical protein
MPPEPTVTVYVTPSTASVKAAEVVLLSAVDPLTGDQVPV